MIFGFVKYEPLTYEDYEYPPWANGVGWCIALSSILCMPVMALYKLATTPGTLLQVNAYVLYFSHQILKLGISE